jgi:concanavalin A-like lectin/glucanase superfamily protein
MSYADRVLETPGLLAYWRCNETSGTQLGDIFSGAHHAALAGGYTLGVAGALFTGDKAVTLNGTTGKAVVAGYNATNGLAAFTFEAWVKSDGSWAAGHETILCAGAAGHYLSVNSGKLFMSLQIAGVQRVTQSAAAAAIPTTGFHYVVGTWTSGDFLRVYLNGRLVDTSAAAHAGTLSGAIPFGVGVFDPGGAGSGWFGGTLDELAIYNQALSPWQVSDHYLSGTTDRSELFAVAINGTVRTAKVFVPEGAGAFTGELLTGSRGSARISLYDLVGATGYRPALGDTLSVAYGAIAVWAGEIDDTDEGPFENAEMDTGVKTDLTVQDWHALPERIDFVGTIAAGTSLRTAFATILVAGLDVFGIGLDAAAFGSLPNGPNLTTDVTCDGSVLDAFNKLQALTGYIWRIDPVKVLKVREPGFESCGFSLADADTSPGVIGAVRVRRRRTTNYVNRVRLTCGPSGPGDPITQTWNGDGVSTSFALDGLNVPASNVPPGVVVVDGVPYPLWPVPTGFADAITWDYATAGGTITFTGTSAAVATGATHIVLIYTPMFPFVVTYEDPVDVLMPPAGHGPYTLRATAAEILNYAEGLAAAQALVRIGVSEPIEVTVRTDKGPAYPGQSIALSFAERGVAGTFMVTGCTMELAVDGCLEYALTCVDGTEAGESWLDFFKGRSASSGGGTIAVTSSGSGGSSTIVTAPIFLGGSRSVGTLSGAATFKPVPSYTVFVASQSIGLTLRTWVASKTGTVTLRLFDETTAAAVTSSTSAPITSVFPTFTEVTATVAVVAGHRYRLEIAGSVADTGVYGIGQLEGL